MTVADALQYWATERALWPLRTRHAWCFAGAGSGGGSGEDRGLFPETFPVTEPKTALMPRFFAFDDPHFPASLRSIPRPTPGLWVRGQLPAAEASLVAIVGSRAASQTGCALATRWASALAAAGHGIISGGALGVDAAAHEGALSAAGVTYAVLGCGPDVVYPDRHGGLFNRIARAGGLLSEYAPGTPPRPGQFPVRNRIIVGLAGSVIIVEARLRSGALVTARLAHQQGRRLLAVPGTPGTDALLQSGMAWRVETEADVFMALQGQRPRETPAPSPASARPLIGAIEAGKHTPAAIALFLGRSLGEVMAALMEAELEGWVSRGAGSHYEVINGH